MSFKRPKLPSVLLEQIQGGRVTKQRPQQSRKDRRKAERDAKKSGPLRTRPLPPKRSEKSEVKTPYSVQQPVQAPKPSIVRTPTKSAVATKRKPSSSRVTEGDNEEIAALERKLGLNRKKSKKTGEDELDWLVFGSDSEDGGIASKRKQPEDDDWLRSKRQRATRNAAESSDDGEVENLSDSKSDMSLSYDEGLLEEASDLDVHPENAEDNYDGFEEAPKEVKREAKKQRENPYIAPPASLQETLVAKYVPPSMRNAAASDEEMLGRLRRQLQGLLNRLSEDKILSILQSVQDVYNSNARQHVTATMVDLLKGRICDPSTLSDTFLILHGGFSSALHRSIGPDFSAQLLESLVIAFRSHHEQQELSADQHQTLSGGKQTLNIVAFFANFYIMQAISSAIIFDYLRILLDPENFSEANTELLLRIIRICGPQLRQDDPTALKDVVIQLQKTVTTVGESNVSVRTKFMIETIHNLKNNRMKTGLTASALSAEHTHRMKKILGAIKSGKTAEPLRINMADLRDSDKKGKWWLIGASWRNPVKISETEQGKTLTTACDTNEDTNIRRESNSNVDYLDLEKLARAQGMNTDVRRAIFVAVTGAVDYEHAYARVMKLNLKSKQQLEIPQVLLHCVGAEPVYNHFYTLVAMKFCQDHKLRKAYHFALLDLFRRTGEMDTADSDESGSEDDSLGTKKIYNLAKLYATLVSESLLSLTILKHLDVANLQSKSKLFLELLLSTVFVLLRKKTTVKPKAEREAEYEGLVQTIYRTVHTVPDMAAGLRYFLISVLPTANVAASAKEAKVITSGCEYAVECLASEATESLPLMDDTDEQDE